MASNLAFAEEFNGFNQWNGTAGTWDTSRWYAPNGVIGYEGEQQWYVNPLFAPTASANPYSVVDGVLHITAKPATGAILPEIAGQAYTSGMITTYHSFAQTYGYFEMRAQLPAGQGLWPSFWLLPTDNTWPPELDVMEVLEDKPGLLHTTVHTAISGAETVSSNHFKTSDASPVADTSAGFHTYGVDWEADLITWYFDGRQVFQAPTPADLNKPMYMLANLAVGGAWPGAPDATTPFPATMQIDYIRAYSSLPKLPTPLIAAEPGKLVLHMSEDRYRGDAKFTVSVDGVQHGGVRTVTALHGQGQSQAFVLDGAFAPGRHTVAVSFVNDAYKGPGLDRNLYIDSIELNGTVSSGVTTLWGNETATLSVLAPVILSPAAGTGPDTLVLHMSEDAFQGHAEFIVSVDGVGLGAVRVVTARHDAGKTQEFTFRGSFAPGKHGVAVTFLNDSYGGPGLDRNLYIDAVKFGGGAFQAGATLSNNGTVTLVATKPSPGTAAAMVQAQDAGAAASGGPASTFIAASETGAPQGTTFLGQLGLTSHDMEAELVVNPADAPGTGQAIPAAAALDNASYAAHASLWGGGMADTQVVLMPA